MTNCRQSEDDHSILTITLCRRWVRETNASWLWICSALHWMP